MDVTSVTRVLVYLVCVYLSSAQENTVVRFQLLENTRDGNVVGNIATESNILQNVSDVVRDAAIFSYLVPTEHSAYFELNNKTGNLNTSDVRIDRETVCRLLVECILSFDVAVKSGSFFAIVTVEIDVRDDNDNAPSFSDIQVILEVMEDEPEGTEFRIESAEDPDMWGNNSIQFYEMEQMGNVFDLSVTKDRLGDFTLNLRLNQKLDRELQDFYRIKIVAKDGGVPVKEGVLIVNVRVVDVNDNPPHFTSDGYNVTIKETITPGDVILTLSAKDPDLDVNGLVSYRISERQSNVDTINSLFNVNEDNGDISIRRDLRHEQSESFEFFVEATDHGDPTRVDQTVVKVTIKDVENNPPVIRLNLLSPGNIGFVNISENEPIGFFVAHVNVEDTDTGPNGEISCDTENGLFDLEKMAARGYKVVVNAKLDHEQKNLHNITISCHDNGTPPKSSSASFLVRVTDVNDNDPKFDMDIYTATLAENNPSTTSVVHVTAKDADSGVNGKVEFELHADSAGEFSINRNSGIVYASKALDRESTPLIVFRVLAIDKGVERRTSTATVSLTVSDENDNTPKITPIHPELYVMENLPEHSPVGFLTATDGDIGDNAKVTFSIAPVSTTFPFVLLPTGEFKTTMTLDREAQSRYEIPVTVTDMGAEPLSNTQYLTIFVTDDNDNQPIVTFPADDNNTVEFLYPVEGYNVVTAIAAYDIDDGENRTLTYSITGGNEMGIFEIDADIGELSVKKLMDIKQDLTVPLTVTVSDRGTAPQHTDVMLNIYLKYANASVTSTESGSSNKYVVISVVVVVATVLFAAAIVGVILFIRAMDRNKQTTVEDGSPGYADSGISSRSDSQSLPPDTDVTDDVKAKKKKEVSFSLDFSLQGLDGGRNVESSTDNAEDMQNRYYEAPPPSYSELSGEQSAQRQERIDSHMKALKLQQFLWEAKSRDWDHTNTPVPTVAMGDSESETSRETVGDSGRGGSEDDVSTSSPVADNKRSFSFHEPTSPTKHVSFLPHHYDTHNPRDYVVTSARQSTPVNSGTAPPRPPSYRNPYQPQNKNNTQQLTTNNIQLALKNFQMEKQKHNQNISLHSADSWRDYVQQHGGEHSRYRGDSFSSIRSNDDDGGSTTTSGSYTLDPDEVDIDGFAYRKDLVV